MTFGYNANLWSDTSKGRIAEFSENLLAELTGERFHPAVYFRPLSLTRKSLKHMADSVIFRKNFVQSYSSATVWEELW